MGMILRALMIVVLSVVLHAKADDDETPNVKYESRTKVDLRGLDIKGELKNPAEFYYQTRDPEKFDSLVKRRKNFHREMLRDAVLSNLSRNSCDRHIQFLRVRKIRKDESRPFRNQLGKIGHDH